MYPDFFDSVALRLNAEGSRLADARGGIVNETVLAPASFANGVDARVDDPA